VLVGPQGFGNSQQYERELAIIRQTHEPAFRVIPVILPKTGSDLPFDFLRNLTRVDWSEGQQEIGPVKMRFVPASEPRTVAPEIAKFVGQRRPARQAGNRNHDALD
jgi:hypothetical protein